MSQESSGCGQGRSRTDRPPDRRNRAQTTRFGTSSETGFAANNGTGPGSATMMESALRSTMRSCVCRRPFALPSLSVLHRLHENILECDAPEIEPADAHLAFRGQTINVANLNSICKNHLHAVRANRALTT